MKLIRFGEPGQEKPGLELTDGRRIDVSAIVPAYDEAFFGGDGMQQLADWVQGNAASAPEIGQDVRLGSPLSRPSKIICIGLNFSDHAAETGAAEPTEPIIFFKATSAITGPSDGVTIPRGSEKTDWEVELGVVIGKTATYVEEATALEHVAGYVLHNDYSERAFQLERGGQWVKGKSCDTFAPVGPFIATPDEISDVNNLAMWLKVNGEYCQQGNSSNLIFNVPQLISYVSQMMTLLPGDIISTGTPAGVGMGMKPPRYLQRGDVVELGIEGLGSQKQVASSCS
ncbi:MAG: 2,4-diketo-3-deoxy-L-fuconate hydrolase [Verrucomicrobiales bacterium]|jgi:2,4-diketo-3-deoxy-L-fuconate hydrolase